MSDQLQSHPGRAEGNKGELNRIDPVVDDFKDFSANLLDILWPLQPTDCVCSSCHDNSGRSVSFQELARLMDGPKVKVFVGTPRVCYVVAEKLLCEKSPYFRATFTSGFAEASIGATSLPHVEAETFEAILKWMMSGMLATPEACPDGEESFIDERVKVLPLVQIYLAAQYLAHKELRKAAVTVFREAVLDGKETKEIGRDMNVYDPPYQRYSFWPTASWNTFLDQNPGFSPKLVRLVVECDSSGEMREIILQCIARVVHTGWDFMSHHAQILEDHPEFAFEMLGELSVSRRRC